MNRKRLLPGAAIVLLLAGAIAGFVFYPRSGPPLPTMATNRTTIRAVLKAPSEGERLRLVTYAGDGVTPTRADVTYLNGDHGLYAFEHDGQTLTSEHLVRGDGTLKKTGARLENGWYEVHRYADDGKSLIEHQLSDKSDTVVRDEVYRADGSLVSVFREEPSGASIKTGYSQSGVRMYVITKGSNLKENAVYYSDDGSTVVRRFVEGDSSTIGYYYGSDGRLEQKREFTVGSMVVTVYGADGKPQFEQTWIDDSVDADKHHFYLSSVSELDEQGQVVQVISMDNDGKTPLSVTRPDPQDKSRSIVEIYRNDGTLAEVDVQDSTGTTIKSEPKAPGEGPRFQKDERLFVELPFVYPPITIASPPDYSGHYGGL